MFGRFPREQLYPHISGMVLTRRLVRSSGHIQEWFMQALLVSQIVRSTMPMQA
jgi:hypothetical protein